jgi:hypothetical protein
MYILEVESLFQNSDNLNKVLEAVQIEIDKLTEISKSIRSSLSSNPVEAKRVMTELTGIYMTLNPVLAIAESEVKNREVKYYEKLRIETEGTERKFVSASAEKQAESSVTSYRRVRNLISAYVSSAEKGISTLQSLLKFEGTEMQMQTE